MRSRHSTLAPSPKSQVPSAETGGLAATVEAHLRAYFAAHEDERPAGNLYDRVVQAVEEPLLRVVMEACGDNQLRAAALLGLNRNTLRKKIRAHGLIEVKRRVVAKKTKGRR